MSRYAARTWPRDALDPAAGTGLVILGMGGPDGPEAVEPFLRHLFADPAVLPLPRWLAPLVGRFIVRRRVAAVRERYRRVGHGGGSPQLAWTRKQARALASLLSERGLRCEPACAMRYWHPFASEALSLLLGREVDQLLVVPAYPQYATATTGSALAAFCGEVKRLAPHWPLHVVPEWHLLAGYVAALAERAAAPLRRWRDADVDPAACALLYAAHSLPERFIRQGDPYLAQTRATVAAVQAEMRGRVAGDAWLRDVAGGTEPLLAFQSKVGPVRWIGPALEATALELAAAGRRRLAIVPVSFTCEHIETVHELDQELSATVRSAGIEDFERAPALNLDAAWLASLADFLQHRAFASRQAAGATGAEKA